MNGEDFRIEHDTMGEVRVPAAALYQAQTQRAVENFPISGHGLETAVIEALARVKKAAAFANGELGIIDPDMALAIRDAADEVIRGEHPDQFPVDVFQTGSGTSSNMNMNEVLATLASRRLGSTVHPNDHVNASQSSNDVFPTAVHLATSAGLEHHLYPALQTLATILSGKAEEFSQVVKAGRTHLMDATPVTLGQEFGGYAAQVNMGIERIWSSLDRISELPLGGTAVGTGINMPRGFAEIALAELRRETGLPLREARNHFEAASARDSLVEASGVLRTIAVSLIKIANDIRWMASGPRTGLGEIRLPDLQPGSSIMPGKVNPVLCEALIQVGGQVIGNDAAVAYAGTTGNFELNVMIPMMGNNVLESIRLLSNASALFAKRTVAGIEANIDTLRTNAESTPSLVTPLNRFIGYENAAQVAKHALAQDRTIREAVIDLGFVERGEISEQDLDAALDPLSMTYHS